MRRSHRLLSGAGAVLATGALLAACAIPVPEPEAPPEQTETLPALDEPRLDRVLAELGEVIAAADEDRDAELLEPRVEDPALSVRAAEYALADATAEAENPYTPQPLTVASDVDIVAQTDTWPRTVMVVTEIPDEANGPLLLTLRQEAPRSQYLLQSWVRLLPGAEMPGTAIPGEGSAPVPDDAEGYVYTPTGALSAYAEVLSDSEADEAADFADDVFRDLVGERQGAASEAAEFEEAGEFAFSTSVPEQEVSTLATADGGYIVVGALRTRESYTKTVEGSELTVGGTIGLLDSEGGEIADVGTSIDADYRLMVSLYVPPEGEDAQVRVLGAEEVLTEVSRSQDD
ncbi:hypothetical protein LQF12_11355 [Ruania suaedae]|uniref:hypothetical protein n=1 Tax=Ruania suaedae TaxID=2897774 RepID=UPI001E3CB8FF|nr:hypothetical protein [Ruania suaedae]UFU02106.1 hypothetical protein LQF12_11355 [Ruania suaedae]